MEGFILWRCVDCLLSIIGLIMICSCLPLDPTKLAEWHHYSKNSNMMVSLYYFSNNQNEAMKVLVMIT